MKKWYKFSWCLSIIFVTGFIVFDKFEIAFAQGNVIWVHTKEVRGELNKRIFGNNLLGVDSALPDKGTHKPHSYGEMDYGSGIWDSKWNKPNEDVIRLAKDAGISILRFPGGGGANWYDWKLGIQAKRDHFLYGIGEFLITCRQIGAEIVYTLNCSSADDTSNKELIQFLDRAGVRYIEVGNEVWDHMGPAEYSQRYLRYYNLIKAINGDINVGLILHDSYWNQDVLQRTKNKIDFGVIHVYPAHTRNFFTEEDSTVDPREIFRMAWANVLIGTDQRLKNTLAFLQKETGRDVPLAVTEYNGGFSQSRPVPYRFCLGNALLNAELLRIFMDPKNKVLMANHWVFVNTFWGMISNGFNNNYARFNAPYFKRSVYYVFEMYHKYFDEVLVNVDTECAGYDIADRKDFVRNIMFDYKVGSVKSDNLLPDRWQIDNVDGVKVSDGGAVLRVAFEKPAEFNYFHSYKMTNVEPDTYYKLSGYIKVDDLVDDQGGVCLEVLDARGWAITQSAANTKKLSGTSDWQFVEALYLTRSDAKTVRVMARRISNTGPLKGMAEFRDVKLEKFVPNLNTTIPYLSVNASKSRDGKRVSLMVVNKNTDAPVPATIYIEGFTLFGQVKVHVLNGPSIASTNDATPDIVRVKSYCYKTGGGKVEYVFEPHSLTAIELQGAETP